MNECFVELGRKGLFIKLNKKNTFNFDSSYTSRHDADYYFEIFLKVKSEENEIPEDRETRL